MGISRKKVLVIAYYFPPTGGGAIQRTIKLVKYLSRLGWEPFVLTVKGIYYKAYDETPLTEVPDIPVVRAGSLGPLRIAHILRGSLEPGEARPITDFSTLETGRGAGIAAYSGWQRSSKVMLDALFPPDIAVFWVPFAIARGFELCRREGIDVLYSISPQESAHLVGNGLRKLTGLPWVADLTDPWVGHMWREELPKITKKAQECLERNTLKNADALVLSTEATYENAKAKFPDIRNKLLLSNGFDLDDYQTELPDRNENDFVIVHIGNFNKEQRADTIIEGFDIAGRENKDFRQRAKLYLIGSNKPEDFELVRRLGLGDRVFDAGYVSYYDAVKCAKASDVCLLYKGPGISGASITGKFYIYVGAEKPIIGITPSPATNELGERLCSRYYKANPDDTRQIADAFLRAFEERNPQQIDWEEAKRFDYKNIAGEVARLLDELITKQML
jgi:glycosyltransferase involved in cell wall biosynthesis